MKYQAIIAFVLFTFSTHIQAEADWRQLFPSLSSPDKWMQQQCLQQINHYSQIKLSASQRNQTCDCMTNQAKQKLSHLEIIKLMSMSKSELEQQYGKQALSAFNQCQKIQKIS